MKKVIVLAFLFAIVFGSVNAAVAASKKDVIGEWKYDVPDASYGYQKGTFVFNKKEGELAGQVIFEDGYKLELKKINYNDGVLTFGLYIDSEYIYVKAKIESEKLTGTVDSPEGTLEIKGKKIK